MAGGNTAILLQPHADRGLRIGAFGDGIDLIQLQPRADREQLFHGLERRIHRAVAMGGGFVVNAINFQRQVGGLWPLGAANHAQVLDFQPIISRVILTDQRDQVVVVNLFFPVSEVFESDKHIVQLIIGQLEPQIFQLGPQRGTSRMFAHHQIGFGQPHVGRAHDLKGFGVFQHTILMNAGFVGKGVLADNRLVKLHRKTGNGGNAARDIHDLGGINPGAVGHDIAAHLQRHHHFLQRGIAGAFAQAIDRALNLPGTPGNSGQRICGRHP